MVAYNLDMDTATRPYDVPYWSEPETVNVTDIGPIVPPAHFWTQLEPNGPHFVATDLMALQQKCEDALGLSIEL